MSPTQNSDRKDELEFKRLELEQQKLEIEREKLVIERLKARWTGISILIPLLVIAITVSFNIWNQAQQAQNSFELKAAEIVLSASKPSEAAAKAKALEDLFPGRLPNNFYESFQTENYSGPSTEGKKEILRLIVEHSEQKQEIISLWQQLFPSDKWVENLK